MTEFNMKGKLPKDWIAVSSKSHPDRIYYFNVKTNRSTWSQPMLDEVNKTSLVNKSRKNRHKAKDHIATTPEHNWVEDETSYQQHSHDKIIETAQMKAVREKMQQKLLATNKSFSSSKTLSAKPAGNNRTYCSSKSSSSNLAKNDKLKTSLDKNDNKTKILNKNDNKVSLTPQMRVLYQKIEQRTLETSKSNPNKKMKIKSKQQDLDKKLHDEYVSRGREPKPLLRKNLAKERMQRLRKSLNFDKEKLKEIAAVTEAPQKSSKSLSGSYNNSNSSSTCVYKNVEVRLKRLHNKVLKDAMYGRNATSNGHDKSQTQQDKGPIIDIVTKDKLIEQANQEVLYEEMDWEPMEDEEIALEVEVARTQLGRKNHVNQTNCISENTIESVQLNRVESQEKSPLYIVVDTNVFLSELKIVEEARDITFKNYSRPFIVIPWCVIGELDYFKVNESKPGLWAKARRAISFIHEQFSSKHPRVIGQTREQAAKNRKDFSLNCPDDEILQCCLQIHQLQKPTVLLSFDKNLRNKAMVYNILALGRNDPLEKIDYFDMNDCVVNHLTNGPVENSLFNEELLLTDNVFEDTKAIMRDFLSTIIIKQMSEIYGATEWKIYVIIKPPWTIVTALKCAIKHWIAAISESFQRRAEYILKDLLPAFEHLPAGGRKLQDMEYVLEKCSDLVQTVNMDKHCELMTETFNAIMELKKRCLQYIADMNRKKLYDKIGIAKSVQEQEARAEKVFQCFQYIYNYARDLCGLACSNAGMAHSFAFKSLNPPLSDTALQYLRSEITRKVTDLTHSLNKLLMQAENSIKYQALINLQQNLNTFLPDTERMTFDVTPLDIYYCVQLKEEVLKTGLRQLQELTTHFCALAVYT